MIIKEVKGPSDNLIDLAMDNKNVREAVSQLNLWNSSHEIWSFHVASAFYVTYDVQTHKANSNEKYYWELTRTPPNLQRGGFYINTLGAQVPNGVQVTPDFKARFIMSDKEPVYPYA